MSMIAYLLINACLAGHDTPCCPNTFSCHICVYFLGNLEASSIYLYIVQACILETDMETVSLLKLHLRLLSSKALVISRALNSCSVLSFIQITVTPLLHRQIPTSIRPWALRLCRTALLRRDCSCLRLMSME